MTVLLWTFCITGVALAIFALRRSSRVANELKQLKREQYYADGRLKRMPEEIREAVEPLRLHLAKVASGGHVPSDMILDGRLYTDVTADQARHMLEPQAQAAGKVLVVDVRTTKEYTVRHVPGAKLVPFEELEARYKTDIPETAEKVFVYCMGGERSRSACDFLGRHGYTNLYNIKDGLAGWRGAIEGEGELKMVHFEPSGGPRA
jgi:rhodanese-related sulfurtransferase